MVIFVYFKLGLNSLFNEREAQLTKIVNNNGISLRIGGVFQKNFLQIEEKGGRGAAVRSGKI